MILGGSLFAGIGGLGLGLESAFAEAGLAYRVIWQVEQAEFPRRVLAKHWPHADRSVTDVRAASRSVLAPVDVLDGGFPCTELSVAGKGEGLAGENSGLWSEYLRCIREFLPTIAVVENVSALLARGFGTVLGDLAASGYDASWRCIRASDVGAPHVRDRLFIVAHSHESRRKGHGGTDGSEAAYAGPSRGSGGGSERGMGGGATGIPAGLVLPSRWPAGKGEEPFAWEPQRSKPIGAKNRAATLKAYGNAVSPIVAREVGRWIVREGWLS